MKFQQITKMCAVMAAASTMGVGCMSPEYKIVEKVQADGSVVKVVQEKNWQDRLNDSADNNRGLLRYAEVGAQVGGTIWNGINGTVQNNRLQKQTSAINRNANAINRQTQTIGNIFQLMQNQNQNQ